MTSRNARPGAVSRLRILAVTNVYPTSEMPYEGVFVERRVRGLRDLGHDVDVVFAERKARGIAAYGGLHRRIRERIRTWKPDVVHAMYGGINGALAVLAAAHVPSVVTFGGTEVLGGRTLTPLRRVISLANTWASKYAAVAADAVIVVSENLAARLPVCARIEACLPNPVDLERFYPVAREEARRRAGWDPTRVVVLFAADPTRSIKRFDLAQRCVAKLKCRGRTVELRPLGGVPPELVPIWMNAADAVLLTSAHEGSPNVIKEALACGRPIVSTDVGDVRRWMGNAPGSIVVDDDEDAIADALACVLGSDPPDPSIVRAVVEGLSIRANAERHVAIYRSLLDGAQRPA